MVPNAVLLLIFLLMSFPAAALEDDPEDFQNTASGWTLYSNFRERELAPEQWGHGGASGDLLEFARHIQSRHLVLKARTYNTAGVSIHILKAVKGVKARLRLLKETSDENSSCSTAGRYADIGFAGYFFNSGREGPGYTGDVAGVFAIISNEGQKSGLIILAYECLSEHCDQINMLGQIDLGQLGKNRSVELGVLWDEANDQFVFEHGTGRNMKTYIIGYFGKVTDTEPPHSGHRVLGVQAQGAGPCGSVEVRGHVHTVWVK